MWSYTISVKDIAAVWKIVITGGSFEMRAKSNKYLDSAIFQDILNEKLILFFLMRNLRVFSTS
jgi:hypothetical protein